jgi:muramoyltetrapeptide carboxypeptidase LdcA involved in peptidoglycan recycling
MLTQLQLSGVTARARAIVFGEMRGCDEPNGTVTAVDAITRATGEFAGPIIAGFPSGHTTGPTWTLPLGVNVRLSTRPKPVLLIEDAAVE